MFFPNRCRRRFWWIYCGQKTRPVCRCLQLFSSHIISFVLEREDYKIYKVKEERKLPKTTMFTEIINEIKFKIWSVTKKNAELKIENCQMKCTIHSALVCLKRQDP
jgi:hypothetical protein